MDWPTLVGASTVSGSIANWMSKASIGGGGAGGVADTILQEAQAWIYRRLRHWQMLTAPISFNLVQGTDTIPFPTNFLEPDSIWYLINNSPYWLTQKLPNQIYLAWLFDQNGNRIQQPPVIFSFNGSQIQLDSPPDQNYPAFITYYQQPSNLSQSNPTNFLTTTYPRLLRVACMAGACEWAKDNGQGQFDRTYWDQVAMDEISVAQAESDRARRGAVNAGVLIGGTDAAMGLPAFVGGIW